MLRRCVFSRRCYAAPPALFARCRSPQPLPIAFPATALPVEDGKSHVATYVLESRGERLVASVLVAHRKAGGVDPLERVLSVAVYARDKHAGGVLRRVHPGSLADRVLFLGHPASLAVDAARFGGAAGCAFFVVNPTHARWTAEERGGRGTVLHARHESRTNRVVYKHSFAAGETTLVDMLPAAPRWAWGDRQEWAWVTPAAGAIVPACGVPTPQQ